LEEKILGRNQTRLSQWDLLWPMNQHGVIVISGCITSLNSLIGVAEKVNHVVWYPHTFGHVVFDSNIAISTDILHHIQM